MEPQKFYQDRITIENLALQDLIKKIDRISWIRLLCVLGSVPVLYYFFYHNITTGVTALLGTVGLFAFLVSKHQKFQQQKKHLELSLFLWQNEENNIKSYSNVYYNGYEFVEHKHPYSQDLDLFGDNSVFSWISRARTYHGIHRLTDWFTKPRNIQEILNTQTMVKELSHLMQWRHDFALSLWPLEQDQERKNFHRIINLTETPVTFGTSWNWIFSYSRWAIWWILLAGLFALIIPVLMKLWTLILIIHALLNLYFARKVNVYHHSLTKLNAELLAYSTALELIEQMPWTSIPLNKMVAELKNKSGRSAVGQLRQLARIGRQLDLRLNMLGGLLFNVLALWDFRQLAALKLWQQDTDQSIKNYFLVLGELEAISSLATLQFNQPGWIMPEFVTDYFTLSFKSCGHPLIPLSERINNDYSLVGHAKIDVITGSNMAGKSTFLRTLGVNFILAHLGGPVCASEARLSTARMYTSMRIADNVNEHTSTFKAELNRLRLMLDALKRGEQVFVLIDEMLRGTNSQDKYLGSRAMILKLLAHGAVGLVATHDLQLAAIEDDHPGQIRNFYFDITVAGGEYHFDYKLKSGRCTTFNASSLLRDLGLDV